MIHVWMDIYCETVDEETHRLIAKPLVLKKMCRYHTELDRGIDFVGCKLCSRLFSVS